MCKQCLEIILSNNFIGVYEKSVKQVVVGYQPKRSQRFNSSEYVIIAKKQ